MTRVTQQHVDARRDSILEAAARLFARNGVAGATMADIAREADLSAGAIYRYYSSKEELLRAVFEDAIVRNQEVIHGIEQHADSPLDALIKVGYATWVEQDDRDDLLCQIQMTLSAAREPDDFGVALAQMDTFIREQLIRMIKEAQLSGEIDPAVDPNTLATIFQACTSGVQMMKLSPHHEVDVRSALELLVRMTVGLSTQTHDASER